MSAPDPDPTSYRAFLLALQRVAVGALVSANVLREMTDAAGIPGSALGACFKAAQDAGYLWTDGLTVPSDDPAARGRRVLLYELMRRPDLTRRAA